MTSGKSEEKTEFRPRDRWLLFALFLGPAAWMLHLDLTYMLVPESCGRGSKLMLHGITLGCVAIALLAAGIAWKIRSECEGEPATVLWKDRTKWIATTALVLALSMVVVIVAQEIPNVLLRSCD